MNINIELTSKEHKDLLSYCKLNNFEPETILKSSYLEGFKIEKYGLFIIDRLTASLFRNKKLLNTYQVLFTVKCSKFEQKPKNSS